MSQPIPGATQDGTVLVVRNIPREGPGILGRVLAEEGVHHDVVDVADLPRNLPDCAALVVLGGPASANDDCESMTRELTLVGQALEQGLPYLGVCLGLQVAVKAAGGRVVPSPVKEVGWCDAGGEPNSVRLTDAGRRDPLFDGLPDELPVFHLHGETVETADGMQVLATGHCRNQVVKVADRAYGVQAHVELTPEMLAVWAREDPDLRPLGEEGLLQPLAALDGTYARTGETLVRNFLRIAGLA